MAAATQPPKSLVKIGFYEVNSTIGKGNYACVKLAKHRVTKTEVAIKIVDKTRLDAENLNKIYREIVVLKSLNHPHIIKLYQVMETKNILYLVTEYAPNGEIFDLIARQRRLTEEDARYKFWQIISAVDYCHKKGVVHRDLKAENLLLDSNFRLKIADFGFSNFFTEDEQLNTFCGSPPYAAPEVFEGKKYQATHIDIWSLGVVLYVLVCGALPFEGGTLQELRDRVLSGRFRIPYFMSSDCENLIRRMLNVDPHRRPTMDQIRSHKWMQHDNLEETIQNEVNAHQRLSQSEPQPQIISLMHGMGIDQNRTKASLKNAAYDNFMAIYLLLFERWRSSTFDPRRRIGEMHRTPTDPEMHKEETVPKRSRPLLNSLRDHSTFRTMDTTASSGFGEDRSSTLSRQSTIGTIGSIDEGVETDVSATSGVTFSSGEMISDSVNQCTFDSLESPIETDIMSSLSSCPNRSNGSTQSQDATPLNTSMNSCGCTPEASTSNQPTSFGQGWRASDNTMFQSVHSPFPTGQLTRGRESMGECRRLRPSTDAMEKLQKMRICQRSPSNRRTKNSIGTLSKRISLPQNLEFQPQKLLNIKQSMHLEQQLEEGNCLDNKAVFRSRFHQKQLQMKSRMKLLRQQSYQMAQKQSVLPGGALASFRDDVDDRVSLSPTLLSPILDSYKEDSMEIA